MVPLVSVFFIKTWDLTSILCTEALFKENYICRSSESHRKKSPTDLPFRVAPEALFITLRVQLNHCA